MLDKREKRKSQAENETSEAQQDDEQPVREIGGPKGPEPTRFGDWERSGRCIDF